MKKVVLILALILTSSLTFAQDATTPAAPAAPEEPASKFTAAVDVVYPYLWRGIKLNSDKVAFQPYASYAATDKLTLGVWGTTNLSGAKDAYNEFDWYISYQATPVVKVMLSDYYYNGTKKANDFQPSLFIRNSYWKYDINSPHVMDLSVLLNFSDKGVPLDFQWNTLIGGNDFKDIKTDTNGNITDKKRAFSTYSEIGYTYSIESAGIDLRAFVGAAVINENGYYGVHRNGKAGFSFTNVGLNASKAIKISEKFSLPVFIRYTYNEDIEATSVFTDKVHNHFISGGMTFTIK
jgi:Bacterial protein of unknown function (Gcw_chp)